MKKVIAMFLAAAMLTVSFVGCKDNKNNNVSNSDVKAAVDVSDVKLIKDGTLSVGMEIGYPPFEDKAENGDPIGYDVDLVYAVADKLGLEVNLIDTGFDVIFAGIGTNYDCVVSAVTITDERRENCLFSDPYIDSYQAVVIKKGSDIKIDSLKDLTGKSVALQDATTSKALLEDMIKTGTVTNCKMGPSEKVLTAFTALDNGEYDVVLCDSPVAETYLTNYPDKYELAFLDNENVEQFGIAMAKDNTALQTAVNEALAQLKEEGFFEENTAKWFA
jgi:polar amino acid transport system substrate-binding protein